MSATHTLTIRQPDDWHLHVRDGDMLGMVLPHTARQFGRAIIMPNLQPPVVRTTMAAAYRNRILGALQRVPGYESSSFTPLMTLYLTDNTTAADIQDAVSSGFIHAVKLYPAGATTNSDAGVTDLFGRCSAALEAMQKLGLPLLVHGEVTDPDVDIFDREAVFIERVMQPLRRAFPALKVVFEHLTTSEGVDYVTDTEGPTAATITAHHLLYNRNAIFQGGVRPHYYCLPVLKRETHRRALLRAATSDTGRFFLGTDSAPHLQSDKEAACGCAGCYTAIHAMALYAWAFEQAGCLERLEAFASLNGPAFYGLPVNSECITLQRRAQCIPDRLAVGDNAVIPLAAGESLPWSLAN